MPRIIIYIVLTVLALLQTACGLPQGVSRDELEAKGAELNALSRSRIFAVLDEPYLGARPVPITKNDGFSSGVFARHITMNRQGSLADICAAVTKLTGLAISVDAAASRPLVSANASGGAAPKDSDMDAQLAAALGLGQEAAAPPASPEEATEAPKSARPRGGVRIAYEGTVKGLLDLLSARFGLAWEYNPATGVLFSTTAIRTFTIWAAPGAISYSNNITNASKESNSGGRGKPLSGRGHGLPFLQKRPMDVDKLFYAWDKFIAECAVGHFIAHFAGRAGGVNDNCGFRISGTVGIGCVDINNCLFENQIFNAA